jgi:hypothetical protein
MTGTSIAVPVITGFMALVLAEFQDVFTRDQILKVVYTFSMKLSDDEIWTKYIKCGTPDMRSALLCLHVLEKLKSLLIDNKSYAFDAHFDNLVQAIWIMNYQAPSQYEELFDAKFTSNFSQFADQAKKQDPEELQPTLFTPMTTDLAGCIDFISSSILHGIDSEKYDAPKKLSEQITSLESLQKILSTKKYNLFALQPKTTQARITSALTPRTSCMIS